MPIFIDGLVIDADKLAPQLYEELEPKERFLVGMGKIPKRLGDNILAACRVKCATVAAKHLGCLPKDIPENPMVDIVAMDLSARKMTEAICEAIIGVAMVINKRN